MKECSNCHYGYHRYRIDLEAPCSRQGGCYFNKNMPEWKPMTHGDTLRNLSDRELAARLLAWQGKKLSFGEIFEWMISEVEENDGDGT